MALLRAIWRDFGAAVGPAVAGIVFTAIPPALLYGACAGLLALLLWWCIGRAGRASD